MSLPRLLPRLAALAVFALAAGNPLPASAAPPVITQFNCPVFLDDNRTAFLCDASYSSSGATSVAWSVIGAQPVTFDDGAYTGFFTDCDVGQRVRVTLRVTNADGSAWRSALFNCGPVF